MSELRILSGDEIKGHRHDLFLCFKAKAKEKLEANEISEANSLAATALKTIQEVDESVISAAGEETHVEEFREMVEKAYAAE